MKSRTSCVVQLLPPEPTACLAVWLAPLSNRVGVGERSVINTINSKSAAEMARVTWRCRMRMQQFRGKSELPERLSV